MSNKIKLNLFDLKSKENLQNIHFFFKTKINKWFDAKGLPKSEFFEYRNCPLCDEKSSNEVFAIEGFSYHKCIACESLYTKPHLIDGVLDELYSDGTYQHYQDSLVKSGSGLRKGVLEQRKFKQLQQMFSQEKLTLLDVGCGGGTFLEVCHENGWKVEGIDPSPDSTNSKNIKVQHGDFNQIKFDKKFDVISFWGVLEHLSNPNAALKKASQMLNKSGMIVFEVPSADCFLSEYLNKTPFSPTRYIESGRHNIFFSKKVINNISERYGLSIEFIESNGLDIQTILLEEFSPKITEKIINMQDTINNLMLGDHYRVFLRKNSMYRKV